MSAPQEAEGAAEVSHSIGFWCQHGLGTWKSLSICRVNIYTCNLLQAAGCSKRNPNIFSWKVQDRFLISGQKVLNVANQGPRLAPSGDSPPTLPLVSSTLWAAVGLHRPTGGPCGGVLMAAHALLVARATAGEGHVPTEDI